MAQHNTRANILKAAKARHIILSTLQNSSQALGIPQLRELHPELVKLHPVLERTRQLAERMVKNGLIRKASTGLYASMKANGAAMAPARSARPLTVDRLSRIEHKLDLLLKALDVREH
jgi:hypothetical protein